MLLQLRLIIVALVLLFVGGCYSTNDSIPTNIVSSKKKELSYHRQNNKQSFQNQQVIKKNEYSGAIKLLSLPETLPCNSSSTMPHHDHYDESFKGISIRPPEQIVAPSESSNASNNNMDHYYNQRSRSLLNCVYNETQLRTAISNVPCCLSYPTRIDICSSYITIDGRYSSVPSDGILLRRRNLELACNLAMTGGRKCTFDAKGITRHFTMYKSTASFYDIKLINGASVNDMDVTNGGAIIVENSTLSMIRCVLQNNVGNYGGAIHARNSTISWTSCNIYNNAADNGGVIYLGYCSIVVTDCNITGNYASSNAGVFYADTSSVTVMASTMKGNGCPGSGGIIGPIHCNIVIIDTIMQNNYAGYGGIMSTFESTTVTIVRCSMISNKARGSHLDSSYAGGAIYLAWNSTLQITDCYIYGNTAQFAGAFIVTRSSQIVLMRCTAAGNHADYNGGAIYIDTYSSMQMIDCDVSNNTATYAGGGMMARNSSISLKNVIFNNNMAEQGTIRTHDSTFTLTNISFLSSNPDMAPCNLFVSNSFLQHDIPGSVFDPSYRESCINLPTSTSITGRRLLTKPTIEAHNQKDMTVVDLDNHMYPSDQLVLKDNTSSGTQLSLPSNSTPQRMMQTRQYCVKQVDDFKQLIRNSPPSQAPKPKIITFCQKTYHLPVLHRRRGRLLQTNMLDGIDISNKNIVFVCQRKPRKKGTCTLDAGAVMRHFYGSDTKVEFHNIRFINGYHLGAGGAFLLNNSDVKFTKCSFANNTARSGAGAVLVNQTRLIVGNQTRISQSGGMGAPIEIHSSNATIDDVTITNNSASQFGDSVLLFNSIVNVTNATFGNTSGDCNFFVSVDPLNPTRNKTCVSLS